jgi:DNA-binding NarL/FixJ family response regulator
MEQRFLRLMAGQEEAAPQESPPKALSYKEREVLGCLVEGLHHKQAAEQLQISERAVKAVIQRLFARTGVRTRSQLVRVALERYRDQV